MCKLVLDGGNVSSFTSVSNVFIDEYMNKANGEFVKIYLYLLRLVSKMIDAPEEFSTEKIADHFGILESDVYRALTYWNVEEVLSLSFNDEGKIEGVLGGAVSKHHFEPGSHKHHHLYGGRFETRF